MELMVLDFERGTYIFVKHQMARDTRPPPLPGSPEDGTESGLDAHVMVRVTKHTKSLILARAKAAGVAPATWARIQIIKGLMRKNK